VTGQLGLYINGIFVQNISFPSTADWSTYIDVTVNVSIPAGASVKLQYNNGDSGIGLDYVIFSAGSTPAPTSSSIKMEAEDAVLTGNTMVYSLATASNGYVIGNDGAPGDAITFNNVPSSDQMILHYASASVTGQLGLYINGIFVQNISFPSTADWLTYIDVTVNVSIPAGASVKLQYNNGDSGIGLDYVIFSTTTP